MLSALVWLTGGVLGSAFGNVLIKQSSRTEVEGLLAYVSVPFVGGAAVYGLGLLCYMQALRTLPLTLAYPMLVGASVLCTALIAIRAFGEKLGPAEALGIALIVTGIAVLTRRMGVA